jgi:Zn-dependent protease
MTRTRDRRRRPSAKSAEPDVFFLLAFIVAAAGGVGAHLAGLGIGWCIGIGIGIFIAGATFVNERHRSRVMSEMERLIAAGDYRAARRLGERHEKTHGSGLPYGLLLLKAREGEKEQAAGAPREPAPGSEDPGSQGRESVEDSAPRMPVTPEAGSPAGLEPEPAGEPVPEPPPAPAAPVASRLAAVAIALLLPALVPALGLLAAPVLLVLSLVLFGRANRLAWDRRIAAIGVTVAALALLASGAGLWGVLRGAGGEPGFVEADVTQTTRLQVVMILVLVFSIVFHEIAHGAAATISGDTTAREKGRLSLNPIRHIDPIGSVVLPIVLSLLPGGIAFGWAKPVPVNPKRYRRLRAGTAFVSVAGVATNVALALACAALLLLTALVIVLLCPGRELPELAHPLAPVSADWLPGGVAMGVWIEILKAGILINLILASLNLVPIPPLDGSHLLRSILPEKAAGIYAKLGVIGFPLLIVLMLTDALLIVFLPGLVAAMVLTMLPRMLFGL